MLDDLWDLLKLQPITPFKIKGRDLYIYEDAYDILKKKNPLIEKLKEEFDCEFC